MRTIRRLIHAEVYTAVTFVTLGFLSLFTFFDFVDQLSAVGKSSAPGSQYGLTQAIGYVLLLVPNHVYELLPITVLIGAIYVMTRLAQSSEFTILRTSGLGPWRALRNLFTTGFSFVVLTFFIGDYFAPWADRSAQLLKAEYEGNITIGQTGAWLREKQPEALFAVNIGALDSEGQMRDVRLFEFDPQGLLASVTKAPRARFEAGNRAWLLEQADRTEFMARMSEAPRVARNLQENYRFETEISSEMVSAALLKPERMRTIDLFQYIRHLRANAQSTERYEIEFWKKVFYPLSCLVMVVLALPFAYLHFRNEGIAIYVFGGVMAGISFFFLNNVFSYIGELQRWEPWLTAALPGFLYSLLSLGAFTWLVLRR